MRIRRKSPLTGKINEMNLPVTDAQMAAYHEGAFVQVAFPQLTGEQREFILSGYTPEDWKRMFPPEGEESD